MIRKLTMRDLDPELQPGDAPLDGENGSSNKQEKNPNRISTNSILNNLFIVLMIVAIVAGISIGVAVRYYNPEFRKTERYRVYLAFPGDIIVRMLKTFTIPILVTSLISAMSSIPTRSAGWISLLTMLYVLFTSFIAAVLGVFLVSVMRPGKLVDQADIERTPKENLQKPIDAFLDLLR